MYFDYMSKYSKKSFFLDIKITYILLYTGNELASRIISHIKHTYYVKDIDICGSCIILDDEEDMNQEK